ncbi:hypothetical protein GCM10011507_34370 [Edaphobacter acidisoli]|uniref:Uncharacterized protein n=1 Tax=Edaphobacter acidisoli TaxID=2040573 RepID=A0A916WAH3_9BACT|nr:hypothetical protein [Edaphobacter acidisoli]GGA80258.1 hypothetical protein GCM10011507_34370 [Edaphobacter acidisoli]
MKLDLPQELPRRRPLDGERSTPSLEPSPVERRRDSLAAAERHIMPQVPRDHPRQQERPLEPEQRRIAPDRRPRRETLPLQAIGLSLREEEQKVVVEVGRFRVIRTDDLAETVYNNRRSRMERDLAFLRQKGLIEIDTVNARRDGRGGRVDRIEVVVLTNEGRTLAHMVGGLPRDQRLYSGLVKPREVEHDTQIYRAYRKHAERIESSGGTNLRVKLDFELKAEIQKAIHAERKARPQREMSAIKQEVAERFDLPFVNGTIQVPDVRIEFDREVKPDDLGQGARTGHEDIEVLTAAYRPGHLRAKAQAGFHVYASHSDRATLSARIEDDHHLMKRILEL